MKIELVGVSTADGAKGVFDRSSAGIGVTVAELKTISTSVSQFCEEFLTGLQSIEAHQGTFGLNSVEFGIELTLKGEVRLIAAASAETTGSIKLTFGPKP